MHSLFRRHVRQQTVTTGARLRHPRPLTPLLPLFLFDPSLTLSLSLSVAKVIRLALTPAGLAATEVLDLLDYFAESFFDIVHSR